MTTADQLAIIEGWFSGEDEFFSAKVLGDAVLIQDSLKRQRRLLSIVKSGDSSGLFVFESRSYPPEGPSDLCLHTAIPIDSNFRTKNTCVLPSISLRNPFPNFNDADFSKYPLNESILYFFFPSFSCVIDSSEQQKNKDSVVLKISGSEDTRLCFEMQPGYHTESLVAEIFRLTEVNQTTKLLQDTKTKGRIDLPLGGDVFLYVHRLSPELSLNRRDIAMGKTPIDLNTREYIVHYQMASKEDQFTDVREFTVFTGTWNVNDQLPPGEGPLLNWLAGDKEPPTSTPWAFKSWTSPRRPLWAVSESLHPGATYTKLRLIRLVGIMLIVFIKEEHFKYVKNVSADTVGTGIMGKLGNKGGVSVRLEFHNTSICFVNSHLAAFTNQTERRNQDFQSIMDRTSFPLRDPNHNTIKDHEMIYWIGDLNYRINDTDFDSASVKELLKNPEENLRALLDKDQLNQQMSLGRVFNGFTEGEISFVPTYKYDLGTDIWDTSEKARTPSWTDRVLWRGNRISLVRYSSHMVCRVSDHKPVSSVFKAGIKVVDTAKHRRIYEDVMKKLDKLENEYHFESIRFHEPVSKGLVIANTGQVPVQFEFIKKLNDPGGKLDINIEISIDKNTAGPSIWAPRRSMTFLGVPLVPPLTPSYAFQPDSRALNWPYCRLEKNGGSFDPKSINEDFYYVPKELWLLCDIITSRGFRSEQLFLQPGLISEIIELRDWLDRGLPLEAPGVSIHSAAEALLLSWSLFESPSSPITCIPSVWTLPRTTSSASSWLPNYPLPQPLIHYSTSNGVDPNPNRTLCLNSFGIHPELIRKRVAFGET
ncbi:Putative LOC100121409 [Caligus rogercresseyi]|uniref:LOC100121409 n=1 Tax=Caligus rogercresseyi TaxID=217165 RepID=A0A7T8GUP1_CALRO|nr:Putative LOC100121409 [Caligus rogercresseyi]